LKQDDVLRVLVITNEMEDAEQLLSQLRNEGIAVRPCRANDEDELDDLLASKPLDLALVNAQHRSLSIKLVCNAIQKCGKDVPVIALLDEFSVDGVIESQANGALDAIDTESSKHMINVVRRERDNHNLRKRFRFTDINLVDTEKRCNALLDSSRDAIAYVHEGMHVYANPVYLQMFHLDDFDELEGLPLLDMFTGSHVKTLKQILQKVSKGEPPPSEMEIEIEDNNGGKKDVMMEFSSASIDGESCNQIILREKLVDAELARELRDLKTQDLVTGLFNRQHMLQTIRESIGQVVQDNIERSLIFVDIDNFDKTLTQIGISGVDLVLADLAKVIRSQLSEQDMAGRIGDRNFAVVGHNHNLEDAEALAEKIRVAIEDNISEVDNKSITLTCSFGVTSIVENISSAHDLLTMATSAAHEAAREGGNQVRVHDPLKIKEGETGDQLQVISMVKKAIEEDRLILYYQPIVSLHGEEGEYYEVLMRLQDEEGNVVPPGSFMPVLMEHDLVKLLDRWVIMNSIKSLVKQRERTGNPVTFFIKVTARTLDDPTVLSWIAKLMQEHRISGSSMVFEMPESKLMTNLKTAKQFVKGLKELHCKFAIEQFGSGLNSFLILKHLPADYLKIDRTFMQNLPKNEEHQEKIKEIAQQATNIGKQTVAEFVEDAASMSILWQCGVSFVQGNFLQEPEKSMSYEFN